MCIVTQHPAFVYVGYPRHIPERDAHHSVSPNSAVQHRAALLHRDPSRLQLYLLTRYILSLIRPRGRANVFCLLLLIAMSMSSILVAKTLLYRSLLDSFFR
ncbi:hypothetical protein DPSP01_011792 [Paraphaeosphaeria sporulosa]